MVGQLLILLLQEGIDNVKKFFYAKYNAEIFFLIELALWLIKKVLWKSIFGLS